MPQSTYTVLTTGVYVDSVTGGRHQFKKDEVIPLDQAIRFSMSGAAAAAGVTPFPAIQDAWMEARIAASIASLTVAGGDQLAIVEPVACPASMASGSVALTAQSAVLMLVRVTKPTTVTKLSCYTSAATANVDMSILDPTYGEVANLSAPIAAVAGGLTTGTLVSSFTYQPGIDYEHAIVLDASVSIVRGFTGVAAILNAGAGAGTQRALLKAIAQNTIPASIASPAATAVALWVVGHN